MKVRPVNDRVLVLRVEEEQKKRDQLDKTLKAQNQVIDATTKSGKAQKEIAKYQETTAEAQFKSKVLAGQINFEQKATSKEIGLSTKQANNLSTL